MDFETIAIIIAALATAIKKITGTIKDIKDIKKEKRKKHKE